MGRTGTSRPRRLRTVVGLFLAVAGLAVAGAVSLRDLAGSGARDARVLVTPVAAMADIRLPRAGFTGLPLRAGHFMPLACEEAFAGLRFWDPLFVTPLPDGSGQLVVVERRGTIQLLDPGRGPTAKRPLLDITARVNLSPHEAEEGLLGLAFHPEFADAKSAHRGEFFVYYIARGTTEGASTGRLSRWRMKKDRLDEVDVGSEEVLIDQPQEDQAHNGGCVLFGPDGFLYLSLGDDSLPPPNPNIQTISRSLFSGILRLDVDRQGGAISHPPPRQPREGQTAGYFIPSDNPFVGVPDALEEFYAIGLRNPWRMSFDRATGRLYASDVGGRRREEVNLIEKGSNCGWNFAEGTVRLGGEANHGPQAPPRLGVETWPLFEYPRDAAHRCIIGGYVYRGTQFPELSGRYVYADQSGRIYSLELKDDGRAAGENRLIAVLPERGIGISSLGEDEHGELYFCSIGDLATETGRVFRLRRTRSNERDNLPTSLAATGLFENWQTLEAKPWLVPFDVKVPFWSDAAQKRRWIALPAGERVDIDVHGRMRFPPGTVFVKHFDLPADRQANANAAARPLETRVLVCDDLGGVYGATYRWSRDRQAANLVTFNESETIEVVGAEGEQSAQTWNYPGRFECAMCHNDASGQVLGFSLRQLDCPSAEDAGGQIAHLIRRGVLAESALRVPEHLVRRLARIDDESASVEHRVRSYLDVNCSACHNPATRFAAFDARIHRSLGEQGLVDGTAHYHKDRGPDVRIVRPGSIELSMIYHRLSTDDPSLRMPPLGSTAVDGQGVALVIEWILSLAPRYPPQAEPPTVVEAPPEEPIEKTASENAESPKR